MIKFFVPGVPRPQGSKVGIVRGRRVIMRDMSNRRTIKHGDNSLNHWKEKVSEYGEREWNAELLTGRVGIRESFTFARPKSHLKKNGEVRAAYIGKRPRGDLEKYSRAIRDALSKVVYIDDDQVTYQEGTKQYEDESDHEPGAYLEVWEV